MSKEERLINEMKLALEQHCFCPVVKPDPLAGIGETEIVCHNCYALEKYEEWLQNEN